VSARAAATGRFAGQALVHVFRRVWLILALFLAWWAVTSWGWVSSVKLPPPGDVWDALGRGFSDLDLWNAIVATLVRLAEGWAMGAGVAVLLGILTAASPFLEDGIRPLIAGLQGVPTIAFLPLAILWFGPSGAAVLAITAFGTFKPMMLATYGAVRQVPPTLRQAARSMGASGLFFQRTLVFPAAIPGLVVGLRLSWSFAWRSLMAAELIVGGIDGLGQVLERGRELNSIDLVIAVILVIAAVGILFEQLVFARFEHWVQRRWGLAQAV
jgi:NitT/TauT family transport system permease protein